MDDNPFVVLGVRQDLIARELARENDEKRLVMLAEGIFAALVKLYHTDRPDGDAHFMSEFSRAIELVREPGAAVMYAQELIDEPTLQRQRTREATLSDAENVRRRLKTAIEGFALLNQLEVAKVIGPATLFVQDGPIKYQLNVLSASETQLWRFNYDAETTETCVSNSLSYEDGAWRESFLGDEYTTKVVCYDSVSSLGTTSIVGSFELPHVPNQMPSSGFSELEPSDRTFDMHWSDPWDVWYLDRLEFEVREGENLVIRNAKGQLAVLGVLIKVHVLE